MTDFEKFSDKELYDYCKQVGFNARVWTRKFIAALPEVAKRRLYKKYGYCSIHEFAAKMAGVSHNNVDEVLRIDEKLKDMSKIKSLIAEKGLNKVRLVANIVKPETENFWIEKIQKMTLSSLRIFINEKFRFKTEASDSAMFSQKQAQIDLFDSENFRSQEDDASTVERMKNKKTFTIQIEDEVEFELRKFKKILEKEKKEPVDWNFALKEMAKRALKDEGSKQKQVRVSKQKVNISRYIPAKNRHDLEQKYHGHCAYTGCNKPAEHIHHKDGFAAARNHENIIPLCKNHHDFVHQVSGDEAFNKFKSEKSALFAFKHNFI